MVISYYIVTGTTSVSSYEMPLHTVLCIQYFSYTLISCYYPHTMEDHNDATKDAQKPNIPEIFLKPYDPQATEALISNSGKNRVFLILMSV